MTFVWFGLGVLALIVVVITLVDIFRRGGSFWSTVGWSALVIVLPFFGSLAYWAMRKPSQGEVEEARLLQDDARRAAARRPIGP